MNYVILRHRGLLRYSYSSTITNAERLNKRKGERETAKTGLKTCFYYSVGALRHSSCCKCIYIQTYNQCQNKQNSVNLVPPGVPKKKRKSFFFVYFTHTNSNLRAESRQTFATVAFKILKRVFRQHDQRGGSAKCYILNGCYIVEREKVLVTWINCLFFLKKCSGYIFDIQHIVRCPQDTE